METIFFVVDIFTEYNTRILYTPTTSPLISKSMLPSVLGYPFRLYDFVPITYVYIKQHTIKYRMVEVNTSATLLFRSTFFAIDYFVFYFKRRPERIHKKIEGVKRHMDI